MTTESGDLAMRHPGRIETIVAWLALLAVLLHATQFSFDVLAAVKGAHLNLCAVDFILWAAFGLWAFGRIRRKDFSHLPVSIPAIIGVTWLALSLIPQLKGAAAGQISVSRLGLAKVVQFAEYFIAGYIVFVEVTLTPQRRRHVVAVLAVATLGALACAWIQYLSPGLSVTRVRGTWFANRNTFGAYLALAIPLLFGVALFGRMRVGRLAVILMTIAALCVSLSGGAFLALCFGLVVVAFLKGGRQAFITIIALCLLCLCVLPHMPRKNGSALIDSVLLYREDDPHKVFGDDMPEISARLDAKTVRLAEKVRQGSPVSYGDIVTEQDRSWKWQQRYKEWQAAVNMMRLSPVFGVGAGSYQKNVNSFYDMPKYPVNLLEPDTLSFYMVWGASAGAPFLFIVLAMFLRAGGSAGRALGVLKKPLDRGLAAGLLGSLAALAIVALFGDPMVRGVGVTVALLLAMAHSLRVAGRASQESQP